MGLVRESLVGLWDHPHDVKPEHFVCSGVFVDNGLILTAKHVFDEGADLWVRPRSNAAQSFPVTTSPLTDEAMGHESLDAALLRIDVMPYESVPAPLDFSANVNELADGLTLNGCFQGQFEPPLRVTLTGFDPDLRHHITDVKQPRGHSGSGLANGHQLWGIAVAHYAAADILRGCAHSISQLWPGWLERFLQKGALGTLSPDVPSHDVKSRVKEIRSLIDQDDLEQAKKRMLDFVQEFGDVSEIDEATMLSLKLRRVLAELESLKGEARLRAETKHLFPIVEAIMQLVNKVVARLMQIVTKGLQP